MCTAGGQRDTTGEEGASALNNKCATHLHACVLMGGERDEESVAMEKKKSWQAKPESGWLGDDYIRKKKGKIPVIGRSVCLSDCLTDGETERQKDRETDGRWWGCCFCHRSSVSRQKIYS